MKLKIGYFNNDFTLGTPEGFTLGKGYTFVPLRYPKLEGYDYVVINDDGESIKVSNITLSSYFYFEEENNENHNS